MPSAKLHHLPYYARIITSIMPGQAWRDNEAYGPLMPGVTTFRIVLGGAELYWKIWGTVGRHTWQ